ncbi:MAG: extracellular solute-binding protein family 5 [Dactylosporangium sp.]|nr:extracellular solute-binding protein family 5 [Dactylosporangium sp.]
MFWRMRVLPFAAVLATALMSTACTPSASSTGAHGTPVEGGTATFAEAAGAKPDYILPMMTPVHQSIANIEQFGRLSYRSLYWIGKNGSPAIDPAMSLAGDPVYSNGNKTVTVTLKDYKWSDGTPVTARDVEFWISLYRANKDRVAGYIPGEFPDNITSVTATNDTTFVLQLSEAYNPQWFTYNELSQLTPIPQHTWDKTSPSGTVGDFDRTPATARQVWTMLDAAAQDTSSYGANPLWKVVDGPWILSEYRSDGYAAFTPNKQYSGSNKPHLDKFVEQPFTSEATELNVLRSGHTIDYGYLPIPEMAQAGSLKSLGYTTQPWQQWGTNFIELNHANPQTAKFIKQTYIRQAMQLLVNQPSYIKGPLRGTGSEAYGPIELNPPNSFLTKYDPSKALPYDPSKAKNLLTSHGWTVTPNGASTCGNPGTGDNQCGAGIAAGDKLEFNLEYVSGIVSVDQEMQALKSDFSTAGIQINLSQSPGNTVLADVAPCKPGAPCKWQILNWGGPWIYGINPFPSDDQMFQTAAGSNYGQYSDPKADQLIQATVHNDDPQALPALANYLANSVPVLWMPEELYRVSAISAKLSGVGAQSPILSLTPEDWQLTK